MTTQAEQLVELGADEAADRALTAAFAEHEPHYDTDRVAPPQSMIFEIARRNEELALFIDSTHRPGDRRDNPFASALKAAVKRGVRYADELGVTDPAQLRAGEVRTAATFEGGVVFALDITR